MYFIVLDYKYLYYLKLIFLNTVKKIYNLVTLYHFAL